MKGYLIIAVIRVLSVLPLRRAQAVGRLLGRLALAVGGSFRKVAQVNVALCLPSLTEHEREQLVERAVINSAMMASELGIMWGRPPADGLKLIRNVHNNEVFESALARGRGVLLLAPHLGNWELSNTYIASRMPLTAMYRPSRNPVFDQWMHTRREQTGASLVPTNVSGVKALYRCLKDGGVVGFLPDQEPKPEGGEFVPFMGITALTPRLPHQILHRTGATAVYIFARRLPDGEGFDIHFHPAPEAIYSADQEEALSAMNQGVAECLAICPEQYQWLYKRFKQQPQGRTSYYRNM